MPSVPSMFAAADLHYRDALRGWAPAAGWRPASPDLDDVALTECLLWDKLGRAIRAAQDSELAAREVAWLGLGGGVGAAAPSTAGLPKPNALRGRLLRARLSWRRRLRGAPLLFCPFPFSRHARMIDAVLTHAPSITVGVPAAYQASWPGAVPFHCPVPAPSSAALSAASRRHAAVIAGLAALGVQLLPADCASLASELQTQEGTLAEAALVLDTIRPDALLVPVDNHSPFLEYVLQARRRGIATTLLQHGLDCEWFALDEAHASHIALWGPEREARYRRDSRHQPAAMARIGNPGYDAWPDSPTQAADPNLWLWVTRPHRPEKCYLPSRSPLEGVHILDALLKALAASPAARLLIKAHPFDYVEAYRERIASAGIDRAILIADALPNVLARAGTVISEDSTAGMDAMLAGRTLVHAHFAGSPPTMPFVDYAAALPGFCPEQLVESLVSPPARDLRPGQQRFLDAFAGPRDHQATSRFATFVEEVLNRR